MEISTAPDTSLTDREIEILQTLVKCEGDRDGVAKELYIAPATVNSTLANIYLKLGVRRIEAAIVRGFREGWLK